MKTGRCESFAEAARKLAERRLQLLELCRPDGHRARRDGHPPLEPVEGAADHRHAALPAQRRAAALRRVAQQHVRPPCPRRHPRRRSRGRRLQRAAQLPARPARAVGVVARSSRTCFTHLHSARSQIFTRMFPRCGVPDAFESWAEYEAFLRYLYATGSVTEHTQLWWSVRLHLAYPDGRDPDLRRASPSSPRRVSLAALIYALAARIARAVDEGEPLPVHPHRFIEENFWRAIRYGLPGDLLDLAGVGRRPRPPGAPGARGARRLGARRSPRSSASPRTSTCLPPTPPSARSPATWRARRFAEIYAEQVARTRDVRVGAPSG